MSILASAISGALVHFVWQGSIIGLLLWIVIFALRNKSANARYWVSCAAMALLAIVPLATTVGLYARSSDGSFQPVLGLGQAAVDAGKVAVTVPAAVAQWQSWALLLWSAGVVLFSLRLLLGYGHAFQLRRRGKPAGESVQAVVERLLRAMSVGRRVRTLISEMSDSPSVVGWMRPVILLPSATLMGLTPLQLEAILAHEIGHIKRYDYLVNMLQMFVETLLFYHPAVWWTSKRIRIERELCCDDLAVSFSGNAMRYARALTTLEKLRLRAPSVAMASTGGPLLFRIQRLVGVSSKDYGPSRLPAVLAIGLGVLCFGLNVKWIQGQDAPGVAVDLGSSSIIHRTPVRYPEAAKKQGITGMVQLEVTLDSTGNVADARVLTGPAELRKAALESVLNWHFTSEAARAARLITISFSEEGTKVQLQEHQIAKFEETIVRNLQVVGDEEKQTIELKLRAFNAESAASRGEQDDVTVRRRALEEQLKKMALDLKLAQEMKDGGNGALTDQRKRELERSVEELKAKLEATRPGGFSRREPVAGRALKGISTPGLSESVRNELISRLPIRIGDTLSSRLVEQTAAAVRSYDEHLAVQFLSTADGQAELRISAPNSERR